MAAISAKLNEVARNAIYEETIRKENQSVKLVETFHIPDSTKMHILPEKPNRTVPSQNPDAADVASASTLLKHLSCLKDTDLQPHERFALPVTGNMEYGFFATRPLIPTNPMFDYKTRSCDVTKFASNFASSVGHSPFSKSD